MLSPLPLSYCTNVHPGSSLAQVHEGLDRYTVEIARRFNRPLAAGLWLASPVTREILATPDGPKRLAEFLNARGLTCYTLNAFPFGDFHSTRVKDNVYLPDWSDPRRLEYTNQCATILAALPYSTAVPAVSPPPQAGVYQHSALPTPHPELPAEGSISTLPLAFKPHNRSASFIHACIDQLLAAAAHLHQLHEETGRLIRLAIEPEPFCLLETTDEALAFFDQLRHRAAVTRTEELVNRHLGLCFDVCHQSVEFEDVADSIRRLAAHDIRINKVHISCAIELDPRDEQARRALAPFAEPRYLHQTFALPAHSTGAPPVSPAPRGLATSVAQAPTAHVPLTQTPTSPAFPHRQLDLTPELALTPPPEFAEAQTWRIHFHVPVDAETLGPLRTTRPDLLRALAAVKALDYAPHLEVETYTWSVLPTSGGNLIEGLTRELTATTTLLNQL